MVLLFLFRCPNFHALYGVGARATYEIIGWDKVYAGETDTVTSSPQCLTATEEVSFPTLYHIVIILIILVVIFLGTF